MRKGSWSNKIGHELSHIKSILVTYYPSNNVFAVNTTKMVQSKTKPGWEAEIEPTSKGLYKF